MDRLVEEAKSIGVRDGVVEKKHGTSSQEARKTQRNADMPAGGAGGRLEESCVG